MRNQTAYLVLMMALMGCFAVLRLNPFAVILAPVNLAIAAGLLVGAAATAAQRRSSYLIGILAACGPALGGVLMFAGVRERLVRLPGHPLMWVLIGLYIAFRLTLNQQHARREAERARPAARDEDGESKGGPGEAAGL